MIKLTSIVSDYNTGKYSVAMLAKKYGFSVGKTYYVLRDAGCSFNHKWKKKLSDTGRANMSAAQKGKKLSQRQIEMIRIRNSCNFNGLNGYGHTKLQNNGYVIAYAPKHPHAHRDGYVMLHTILIERNIGRYLNADEVVHHINHDRKDNRIENLQLMKKKDHMSMHMKERHEQRRRSLLTV